MAKHLKWIRILPKADVPTQPHFIRLVKTNDKNVCLIKIDGHYFATQAKCPHAGADLSTGWCKKEKLICPVHRYEYDLHTGRGAKGQGDYIDVFPVEEREDGIYLGLTARMNWLKKLFRS